ncbi:MAG TPA: VOC family protein [Miltoncostaeaceae bacterium]|nr:VOC family protein [Miltoncostaeaceae bacterium]
MTAPAGPPGPIDLEGLDHVALMVRDLAASTAWYQEVLGLERRFADVWGDVPTILLAGASGVALFPLRDPGAASAPPAGSVAMSHLAFRTDARGYAAAKAALAARGIEAREEDHLVAHSIYFADPDGHRLEITTYDLGS